MSLKKIRAKQATARRHRQLLRAASDVVSRHSLLGETPNADPAEIVAVAFGRHELRIDADEALDYLNAVLAERGFPLRYASTETGGDQ